MSLVTLRDTELNVLEQGQGTPLLLVHGFPLDHTMWSRQADELSRLGRVLAPDLRGFGGSRVLPGKVTMERYADDMAELLDVLGVHEPVVFCGLSMGGYVAWQFWRRHPQRLRALILCDTRAVADTAEVARGRLATAEQVLSSGTAGLVETMIPRLFSEATQRVQPEVVAATRGVMLAANPEGVAAALRGMAERPDVTADLPRITQPTLCLCGEHDVISPVEEMRGMAAAMPRAQFRAIAEAGHMAPLERPDDVNTVISEFLSTLRS